MAKEYCRALLQGFETTSWSMVLDAKAEDPEGPRAALNQLCQTYWPPIYSYFRSRNLACEEAQDLTQEFFFRLIRREFLNGVARSRGKFRTFLLTAAENLLKDEQRRHHAQKRNGAESEFSIDMTHAESLYTWNSTRGVDSRAIFDRQWAQTVLDSVLGNLEDEFSASGRSQVFDALKGSLVAGDCEASYRELGKRLGMSEGAVKITVHRIRKRYRALLRAEVGRTVEEPDQVEEELKYLFKAVTS